jgi:TonB family protein
MQPAPLVFICILVAIVSAFAQSDEAISKAAIISAPRPDYPEEASVRHVAGCGVYQINVDAKTGVPLKVDVLQSAGHPPLNRAAVNGLMRWRAKPGGVRVLKIPVCFELRAGKPTVTYGNF